MNPVPDTLPPAPADMRDRILEATLEAIGRHGLRKLAMQDVGEAAALSRATVYRYFPNKDALLQALARYEKQRFEHALGLEMEAMPEGPDRILAVAHFAETYLSAHPTLRRLRDTEPGFVLAYLGEQLPHLREALVRSLGPALSATDAVTCGGSTVAEISEILISVLVTSFLVPTVDQGPPLDAIAALLGPRPNRPGTRKAPASN